MKNLRITALVEAALTAAAWTAAPQRAGAQSYQLAWAGGFCVDRVGGPHPSQAPGREQHSVASHAHPGSCRQSLPLQILAWRACAV